MMVEVKKDKKGKCWIVSHQRSGYHEQMFLTPEELADLYFKLKVIV